MDEISSTALATSEAGEAKRTVENRLTDLWPEPVSQSTISHRPHPLRHLAQAGFMIVLLAIVGAGVAMLTWRGKVIDSLAVLPLANGSADPNVEYLSDGITETIINSLSPLPHLRVMARSTVFRYKDREADPQKIGRELGVKAVLTGRVIHQGDRLIIKAELVDVADGSQIWGEQYNRRLADLITVQAEIAREISEKLRLRLSGAEKEQLAKRHTENSEAYQLYLKGRYY